MKTTMNMQQEKTGWLTKGIVTVICAFSLALLMGCPAPEEPLWDEPVESPAMEPEEQRQEAPMMEPESPVAPEPEEREVPEPPTWPEEE